MVSTQRMVSTELRVKPVRDSRRAGQRRSFAIRLSKWRRAVAPLAIFVMVGVIHSATDATDETTTDESATKVNTPSQDGDAFRCRTVDKPSLIMNQGGTVETERAVSDGLAWIEQQQHDEGFWDFRHSATDELSAGLPDQRQAATAMALLAFHGAGHTHRDGDYQETVREGLDWLIDQQREDGCFASTALYTHAFCLMALADSFGMTKDMRYQMAAQQAVDFAVDAQDPVGGGWRYRPRQAGDTSVTGWFINALVTAKEAGLEVPDESFDLMTVYLDGAQLDEGRSFSYTPGARARPSMTASGLLSRQRLSRDRDTPGMKEGIDNLVAHAAFDIDQREFYYWYHAAQAIRNYGGDAWTEWNATMSESLPAIQLDDGSWPIDDSVYGGRQGRLYTTCFAVMTLEVYYRHFSPIVAERP